MAAHQFWGFGAGLVVLAVSMANPASDAAPAGYRVENAGFEGPVRAQVIRVIDGDTFVAAARIWLGEAIEIHVRIEGIDAPELHARCPQDAPKRWPRGIIWSSAFPAARWS